MQLLIEKMAVLQELTLKSSRPAPATRAEIEKLRAELPPSVLGKFDRWLGRGKKAVAVVNNNVCSECHMQLPISLVASLGKAGTPGHCVHCGRFLRALPENLPAPPQPERRRVTTAAQAL